MNKKVLPEVICEKALEYLKKYDDIFKPECCEQRNWVHDFSSVTFSSKRFPDDAVEVHIYLNKDGSYHFKDNYFRSLMRDDAISYFESRLNFPDPVVVKVRICRYNHCFIY